MKNGIILGIILLFISALNADYITELNKAKINKDAKTAIELSIKECNSNNLQACHILGLDYLFSYGVKGKEVDGLKILWNNCGNNYGESCGAIGEHELKYKQYQRALVIYKRGCKNNHMSSCAGVGLIYKNGGEGVPKDSKKAVEFSTMACDKNERAACNNLSILYSLGEGVKKDDKKATILAQKSCDLGFKHGCHNLGTFYYHGTGVSKDRKLAKKYYSIACEKGHKNSCDNYKDLVKKGY